MEQELYLPGLSHYVNENGWSGSLGLFCFEIEKPRDGTVRAVVWQGPFCRRFARQEGEEIFPVSEEGVAAMGAWLQTWADAMNANPPRTAEECRAYYERLDGEGTGQGE